MAGRGLVATVAGALAYVCYMLGAVLLLLVLGHVLLGLGGDGAKQAAPEDAYYAGEDMRAFLAETEAATQVDFRPYYHWRGKAAQGRFVNVDSSGNRKTVKYPRRDAQRVFCMGGSTMWGRGVPDKFTIPSLLQERLGNGYDVHNLGEQGFVAVQELNLLLERLAQGDVPDIVVFYDGVNDGYAGVYSPGEPRQPQKVGADFARLAAGQRQGFWATVFEALISRTNYRRLRQAETDGAEKAWGKQVEAGLDEKITGTLDAYEEFVRQARAIGQEYGFAVHFFWQPNIYSLSKAPTPYEQQILAASDPALRASQQAVYTAARERFAAGGSVVFLANLFDQVPEPVYIDFCHTRPRGNRLVADAMARHLGMGN
jgi:hypothetical protein